MRMRKTHIIEYVRTVKFCEVKELQRKYFNSYNNATDILRTMVRDKQLKVVREYGNGKNLYMLPETKVPKQIEHVRLISRYYPYLEDRGYRVLRFDYEVVLSKGLRADAVVVARSHEGNMCTFVIECERSHTSVPEKVTKYEKWYISKEYLEKFPRGFPELVLITDGPAGKSILPRVKVLRLDYFD